VDVVLVGLPGSGKSAAGRRLAKRHGASFVDLDDLIERQSGKLVPAIFAEDGEAEFRRLERRAVASLGDPDPEPDLRRVISTGGGRSSTLATAGPFTAAEWPSGLTARRRSWASASAAAPTSGR
jgi:shikimate kinase